MSFNAAFIRFFTRASVRMLTAEQAVDAVSSAIGLPDTFPGYPVGTRAIELAEGAVDNHFLMSFSRPIRVTPGLAQEQFADLAVGPDGAVYLTFRTYAAQGPTMNAIWNSQKSSIYPSSLWFSQQQMKKQWDSPAKASRSIHQSSTA